MKESQLKDGTWICECTIKERTSHRTLEEHYQKVHNVDLNTGEKLS